MKTDLSKYNNSWYKPGSAFKRGVWYILNIMFFRSAFPFYGFKRFLLRSFGARVGKNVLIKPYVNIKYPWFLSLGNNMWIGEKVWIDNLAQVTIQDNVCISQGALILTGNHDYSKSTFDLVVKAITIEEGVWIGAMAVVCPGVTCKSHSVLSVNSVANKDLDAYTIYTGNPATIVKLRVMV